MASRTATHEATGEPKVTMMDGFETRRTHGSIQSAGTGDASSADQMKFFTLGVHHVMQHADTTPEAEQEDSLPRAWIPKEDLQELPGRKGARTPEEWTLLAQDQGTGPGSKPVNTDL